jgi:Ser/Thr protein kinase RdoA (MazF antagonist)
MTTPAAIERLPAHLEALAGAAVVRMTPLEPWAPHHAQRVDLSDGRAWAVRLHPPSRPRREVEGDAELLRFLEQHDFPAERVVDDGEGPVSTLDDPDAHTVLRTWLIPGVNCRGDNRPAVVGGVGELLGRLHALPLPDEADGSSVTREAGGWHHLSTGGGGRRADVDALLPALDAKAEGLPADQQEDARRLRAAVDAIDGCTDLPQTLINIDFGGPNIMRTPTGELVAVDWTGAGRGARVLSLTGLCVEGGAPHVLEPFVEGYLRHSPPLSEEELDRLPAAMAVHGFVLDCWMHVHREVSPATVLHNLARNQQEAERVSERVRKLMAEAAR